MATMPFGKYRGLDLKDVPEDYLQWLLFKDRDPLDSGWLRTLIEVELRRRENGRVNAARDVKDCPDVQMADEVVQAGLAVLARRYHPDAGGDHEAMLKVNLTVAWLRAQFRPRTGGKA